MVLARVRRQRTRDLSHGAMQEFSKKQSRLITMNEERLCICFHRSFLTGLETIRRRIAHIAAAGVTRPRHVGTSGPRLRCRLEWTKESEFALNPLG